jgi:hypothetical protein
VKKYHIATKFLGAFPAFGLELNTKDKYGRMSPEVHRVLRLTQPEARQGSAVARHYCRYVVIAIAALIVSVGALSSSSRWAAYGHAGSSSHTTKTIRMAETGPSEIAPIKNEVVASALPVNPPILSAHQPAVEIPIPELPGSTESHGLRAPPVA